MSAEASAEGLISRSLFTIEKSAWLSRNGPSPPPAPAAARSPAAQARPWGWRSGNQAAAGRVSSLWDLKRARGVQWDCGGAREPENGSLSLGVLWEPPTGEASISLSPVFCPPLAPVDGCTDVAGWGAQIPFVIPERKGFPEKAIQASGDSPGILAGPPPPIRGAGLGKAGVFR